MKARDALETVAEAKKWIVRWALKGCECPVCNQQVRVWKKRPIAVAVASLVRLVSIYEGRAVHLDKFNVVPSDRNFSQLRLWGLVIAEESDDETKRASGMWYPTFKGMQFAKGEILIPKHVYTYNNKVLKEEGPMVSVKELLETKFDYSALLKGK